MRFHNKIFELLENKYFTDQKFKKEIQKIRKELTIPQEGVSDLKEMEKIKDYLSSVESDCDVAIAKNGKEYFIKTLYKELDDQIKKASNDIESRFSNCSDIKEEKILVKEADSIIDNIYNNFEVLSKNIYKGATFRKISKKEAKKNGLIKEFKINKVNQFIFSNDFLVYFQDKYDIPIRYNYYLYIYIYIGNHKNLFIEFFEEEIDGSGFGCEFRHIFSEKSIELGEIMDKLIGTKALKSLKPDKDLCGVILVYPEATSADILELFKKVKKNPLDSKLKKEIRTEKNNSIKSPREKTAKDRDRKVFELSESGKSSREIALELEMSPLKSPYIRQIRKKFKK